MCHALYHTNSLYRSSVDNIIEAMDKNTIRILSKNIKSMGYTSSVVKDEIQAYMTIDYDYKKFNKGVPKTKLIKHNRIFFDNFMKFFL
jgi:outer membrane lipopolysaccharide assembly protein LptE/RlpB